MAPKSSTTWPVITFDWEDASEREIADNVWHALMAGWPAELTYVLQKDNVLKKRERAWKRTTALEAPGAEVPRLLSRDEYPFACTMEHQGSVWVGHVPAAQNSRQGGKVSAFLARHGAFCGTTNCREGFRFVVRVVRHPLEGRVRRRVERPVS